MYTNIELRKRVLMLHSALLTDRSSWDAQWEEIGKQVLPRSVRLTTSDNNKGTKRYNKIYDNTGVRALRVLAAGMMSGVSSPARPWFKLTIKDKKLSNRDEVKLWLADVAQAIRDVFMRSNVYRALHASYEELGAFGTAVAIIDEDDDSVLHLHTLTLGEYALATDHKGRVRTMVRKLPMTVEQLVDAFGKEACSLGVQMAYNSGNLYQRFGVVHAIFPRRDYDPLKKDAKNKPFASVYIELTGEEGQVLRESGYSRFPVLAPAGSRQARMSTAPRRAWRRWATASSYSTNSYARPRPSTTRSSPRCKRPPAWRAPVWTDAPAAVPTRTWRPRPAASARCSRSTWT